MRILQKTARMFRIFSDNGLGHMQEKAMILMRKVDVSESYLVKCRKVKRVQSQKEGRSIQISASAACRPDQRRTWATGRKVGVTPFDSDSLKGMGRSKSGDPPKSATPPRIRNIAESLG